MMSSTSEPDAARTAAPADDLEICAAAIAGVADGHAKRVASLPGDLAFDVAPGKIVAVCTALRDDPRLSFENLIDVSACGCAPTARLASRR